MPAAPNAETILVFAEAVTLAHVARPICFARRLDRRQYRVVVACADHAAAHIRAAGLEHAPLRSVEPAAFLAALARGKPLYDATTLERYVRDDLALIERFRPSLIVGDFRLSLSASARLARIPYAAIASAYWSPYYEPPSWTIPTLPLTRVLPICAAQRAFDLARPLAFRLHCQPLNAVRRRFGLAPLKQDLRRIYTDADDVLYSDLGELFPLRGAPPAHRFLGPVLWEPDVALPEWWGRLPDDKPIVYVTLGSSGDSSALAEVVAAMAGLPVTVLAATAGRSSSAGFPANVFSAPYLPGRRAALRARLVVSNGGSLTGYQAIAAGRPVLGIAGNLDQ